MIIDKLNKMNWNKIGAIMAPHSALINETKFDSIQFNDRKKNKMVAIVQPVRRCERRVEYRMWRTRDVTWRGQCLCQVGKSAHLSRLWMRKSDTHQRRRRRGSGRRISGRHRSDSGTGSFSFSAASNDCFAILWVPGAASFCLCL